MKKQIPNILSSSRIVFSPAMVFARSSPHCFAFIYFTVGMTDMLDGYLARKYHWESKLGVTLEMLADATYFLCAFIAIALGAKLHMTTFAWFYGAAILLCRLISVILIRLKFKVWGEMHLASMKMLGFLVLPLFPLAIYLQRIPASIVIFYLTVFAIGSLEQLVLALKLKEFDSSCKGLYFIYKEKKKNKELIAG